MTTARARPMREATPAPSSPPGRTATMKSTPTARWAGSHPTSTRANGHNTTNNNQQPSQHPIHKTRPGHSAIIKLVGHAPVRALLGAYMRAAELTSGAGEPKQVFFSFDATNAYGPQAEELVEATRVIHLGDGPEALYGYTVEHRDHRGR